MKITTIGLDLAKSIFQVHGIDATGQVVIREVSAAGAEDAAVLCQVAFVPGRDRGVRHGRITGRVGRSNSAMKCA